MKNLSRFLLILIIAIVLTGCAGMHTGYMANSISLNAANFTYVKQNIRGVSTAKYIIGIGGLAKETLVDDAKQSMLQNNPLRDNQALANVTVNFKTSHYLIYYATVKCTVTADIVEFK